MRHVDDDERRRRLARRHAVHPDHRVADVEAATRAMTVLHAPEPATVHLSVQARTTGVAVADIERGLYDERTVVKQLAMRRTLFVFPRDLLPAAWGSASARVAQAELRRLAAELERAGHATDGAAWLEAAAREVLARLAAGDGLDARALRDELPVLGASIVAGAGKWTTEQVVGPRLLTVLGARGDIVRGRNNGHWRISKPLWSAMHHWLGAAPDPLPEPAGYAELVRRWLRSFGPGTEADLVWWLGSTKAAVRAALVEVGAVAVSLDSGDVGWLMPDDLDSEPSCAPWAALLPTLDPTTMGWKQREHYLDPADVPDLFDYAGNAGTTAWWDGRVVGSWVQEPDGAVRVGLLRDPGPAGRVALDREAARLTTWLDGVVVGTIYSSPAMKAARLR